MFFLSLSKDCLTQARRERSVKLTLRYLHSLTKSHKLSRAIPAVHPGRACARLEVHAADLNMFRRRVPNSAL